MGTSTKVAPCVDFGTNLFCTNFGNACMPSELGVKRKKIMNGWINGIGRPI
jgi:hypothetical protein